MTNRTVAAEPNKRRLISAPSTKSNISSRTQNCPANAAFNGVTTAPRYFGRSVGISLHDRGALHFDQAYNAGALREQLDITVRQCLPELMDDPHVDRAAHLQALRGLTRIYCASRTMAAFWPVILQEAQMVGGTLCVLDLATGGGDFPLDLARRAWRARMPIKIAACDVSPRAVAYARLRARQERSAIRFFVLDVNTDSLPDGYHVITTSLFLHHLSDSQAIGLLGKMSRAAERLVLVDDLRRSKRGLWLAKLAATFLSRSPIVRVDAPRSVRAAFASKELCLLARQAGLKGAEIVTHWPERQMLCWRRHDVACP